MAELLQTPEILELFGEAAECRSDGACPPEQNMQWEWERLQACALQPTVPPLLRLYAWHPWAISLGIHQSDSIVDTERCRMHGIAVVRRPTGGRAVLHAEEVTYAVIVRLSAGRSHHLIYRLIHERIAAALKRLIGYTVDLAPSHTDFRPLWQRPFAAACFSSSARWEISYAGRKLVGSAQRLLNGVVLQHGSILLGPAHVLIADLLHFPSEAHREAFRQELVRRSTTVYDITGHRFTYHDVAAALWESFCGIPLCQQQTAPPDQLTSSNIGSSSV